MNSKGNGTLTVRGLGSDIGYPEDGHPTDLDNHRISLAIIDQDGRHVYLEAVLIRNHGHEITESHPYGLTGMVTDAHYGNSPSNRIPQFRPVPIPLGRGRREASRSSLFPYSKAGLLEMVNREFGTHFNMVRLVPAYE